MISIEEEKPIVLSIRNLTAAKPIQDSPSSQENNIIYVGRNPAYQVFEYCNWTPAVLGTPFSQEVHVYTIGGSQRAYGTSMLTFDPSDSSEGLFRVTQGKILSSDVINLYTCDIVSEASHQPDHRHNFIKSRIEDIFTQNAEEDTESGQDSRFSQQLSSLIASKNDLAIKGIEDFIASEGSEQDLAVEALKIIGRLRDPNTATSRLNLLKKNLSSASHYLRWGAVLGLGLLRDSSTITELESAQASESDQNLKALIEKIVEEFRRTNVLVSQTR